MIRKSILLLLVLLLVFSNILPVAATEAPVIYKSTFTVTAEGGRYQIGFVEMEFKKDFLDETRLPATFEVIVAAENGAAGVYISPDTPDFFKKVHIRTDTYKGLLYDSAKGENIYVEVKNQQVLANHFSWYRFR
ncbi:MAG: hypothetical protein ACOYWZ_15535 [Bacillota bacterium]